MERIKSFACVALLFGIFAPGFAQNTQSLDGEEGTDWELPASYNRVYFGRSLLHSENVSPAVCGINAGIMYAGRIIPSVHPLYLQFGCELNWNYEDEKGLPFSAAPMSIGELVYNLRKDQVDEVNLVNFAIPLNLAWNIRLANPVYLELMAGANFA